MACSWAIRSAWRCAAAASALSQARGGKPCAARSRLVASKSARSDAPTDGEDCEDCEAYGGRFCPETVEENRKRSSVAGARDLCNRREIFMGLPADMHGAEAEDHVAAGGGMAEAEHRSEAREKQHLVKLVAERRAARAGENLVVDHLAVRIHGDVQQKTVRQGKLDIMLLERHRLRILRERDQLGRAHEIRGNIVLHRLHDHAGSDHVKYQSENQH